MNFKLFKKCLIKILKLSIFIFIFSMFMLLIFFIILTLFSYFFNVPTELLNNICIGVAGLSIFCSNYFISRILNQNGLVIGLICGCLFSLLILIISFIYTGLFLSFKVIVNIGVSFFTACLGGVLGTLNSK